MDRCLDLQCLRGGTPLVDGQFWRMGQCLSHRGETALGAEQAHVYAVTCLDPCSVNFHVLYGQVCHIICAQFTHLTTLAVLPRKDNEMALGKLVADFLTPRTGCPHWVSRIKLGVQEGEIALGCFQWFFEVLWRYLERSILFRILLWKPKYGLLECDASGDRLLHESLVLAVAESAGCQRALEM